MLNKTPGNLKQIKFLEEGINTKIIRLKKQDIALVQFILEGYEGIFSVSTIDPRIALICVSSITGFESYISKILDNIEIEFSYNNSK